MKAFRVNTCYLLLLIISAQCMAAPEPICTKFTYEEQLLEKMVRMEFNVEVMEKTILAAEKSMKEIQGNVEISLKALHDKVKEVEEKQKDRRVVEDTVPGSLVAFHAHKLADKSLSNDQVMVFTSVLMNEGNGYDATNGYFTALLDGFYFFSCHLCGKNSKHLEYVFLVNDVKWASGLYIAKNQGTCTSFSVTVKMQSGQRAWVTIDVSGSSSDILFEDDDDWNYFTGFLIRQSN